MLWKVPYSPPKMCQSQDFLSNNKYVLLLNPTSRKNMREVHAKHYPITAELVAYIKHVK